MVRSSRRIGVAVGIGFKRQRRMKLACAMAAQLAQNVDRAPPGDDMQPGIERARRVVGPSRAMDGQQDILDDIVAAVWRHALTAGNGSDERHAIAQQSLVGRTIA